MVEYAGDGTFRYLPTNTYRKSSLFPVSIFDQGHLAVNVGARPIVDLMCVAMVCC